jgi:hypothetical protein
MTEQILPKHILSKSTFLRGCQCTKALYLYKKHPELLEDVSDAQQMIFDTGTNVGILARDLFPGGIDSSPIDTYHYQDAVLKTQELIKNKTKIIYEACFQFEEVLCAVDILINDKGIWKCYEVKSSTSLKAINVLDCSIQYHTLTNSGINLSDISVIHINNQYTREGELDLKQLFTIESVKNEVLELQGFVKTKIKELKSVATSKQCPSVNIGPHCSDPYECDFSEHCWGDIPMVSIFDLVRLNGNKKWDLYNEGIVHFKDIPKDYKLSEGQQLQVDSYLKKTSFIDKKAIRDFLSEFSYALYFLDFESFNSAVPKFDKSKPYQQIPFQYSIHHKQEPKAEIKHFEFLAEANINTDPRIPFIESLLSATEKEGTILVYSSFEVSRLNEIGRDFPKYLRDIENRISRVVDLMLPFQKRWLYNPIMNGSYSIKSVLPSLIPDMSYEHLKINNGGTASSAFQSLYENSNPEEINKIRTALLEYCKMDTYAMVLLLEHLEKI